jgi:hypothetical protein
MANFRKCESRDTQFTCAKALLLVLLFLAAPTLLHAQFLYTTNFTCVTNGPTITTNGTITITGYTGSDGTVIIPCMTNGYPVTSIGKEAFEFDTSLTNVIIPNSITNIDQAAFDYCYNLAGVKFSTNLINIGTFAFEFCTSLTNVMVPDSVESIGDDSFSDCFSLLCAWIGRGATNIGNDVILLPAGAEINDGAFMNCTNLTTITVNTNNSAFSSLKGALYNKPQTLLIQFPDAYSGAYTIPNSVTGIDYYAFTDARLSSITIGSGVTNLWYKTQLPSGFTLYTTPFNSCPKLTNITVDLENPALSSLNGALFDKDLTTLIMFPCGLGGTYTVPDFVTVISDEAFANCSRLSNIIIDSGVTNIGAQAFMGCSDLTAIFFEGNAPNADPTAFENGVTIYHLPDTAGWSTIFDNIPTALWLPQMETGDGSFGIQTNQFGFNVFWASGQTIVVDASTNLLNPQWQPQQTNTLTNCTVYFSDAQWTHYPSRYYRVHSQ